MNESADLAALVQALQSTLPLTGDADVQAELMARGAAAALEEIAASEPEAAGWLGWAAAMHALAPVRGQALNALIRLAGAGNLSAVDALYRLAVEDDLLAARQVITTRKWQPSRPGLRALFDWQALRSAGAPYPEAGMAELSEAYFAEASPALRRHLIATAETVKLERWAEIVNALEAGQPETLGRIVAHYPAYSAAERGVALIGLERLAGEGSLPARETLAQLFLRHEDEQARDIAVEGGYLPEDPADRALFYFLAEAWERYAALDYDHQLLLAAYEDADRSLRRRMIEHARHTGQTAWLSAAGPVSESRLLRDLTDADWEMAIRRLEETRQHAELWRLAQVAPPLWSAAILERLKEQAWAPQQEEERQGFIELTGLAITCRADPLVIHPRKALHAPGEVTGLALRPDGKVLAGGSPDNQVYLWDLPDGDLQPGITSPVVIIRALAFSPDGELLAIASGDNRIRAYRARGGQMLKTLEGPTAPVRALVIAPDSRSLYAAGFDGRLRAYRFPTGPQTAAIQPGPGEIFALAMLASGRFLACGGADGQLHIFTLPDLNEVRTLAAGADTITYLAGTPEGELVASATREAGAAGALRVWNGSSGGLVRTIAYSGPAITALVMLPGEQVLAAGRLNGEITLWNLSTGQVIDRLVGHKKAIQGLAFHPGNERLYSAAGDLAVQVWDLRAFLAVRLSADPGQAGMASRAQALAKSAPATPAEKKWLAFSAALARWRQRYDIELGEFAPIHTGAFDIQI